MGKHVVSMKSTLDDITYFMPSGINTLMGVTTFAGKIFTVTSNTSSTALIGVSRSSTILKSLINSSFVSRRQKIYNVTTVGTIGYSLKG
jgi:hypothetical protein